MAKMGLREVDEAIANNTHPHFTPTDGEFNTNTDKGEEPAPLNLLDPKVRDNLDSPSKMQND